MADRREDEGDGGGKDCPVVEDIWLMEVEEREEETVEEGSAGKDEVEVVAEVG